MLLLGDIVRRHARHRAGKTAYVLGSAQVTYEAFHRRSNQIARALHRLGVRRGDRVAVLAHNCPEYPLIYFAAIKIGAIVVPVNARFKPGEIAVILNHAEAETLFLAPDLADALAELQVQGGLPALRRLIHIDAASRPDGASLAALADAEAADDVSVPVDEQDPHVMLYSSGTTGTPKGVLLSQRSYYLQAFNTQITTGLREDDIGLSMFPMFHMGGWALPLGFWHNGGTVVIMPRADPRAMLEAIARERVSYLYAVPTVYNSMMALPDFDRFDLSSLRTVASGTAAMTRTQVFEIMARFRCQNLFIIYGSTEAGPVSVLRPRDVPRKPESVGQPFLNVEVRLVGQDGRDVAPGETGEIAVRSEFVMRGYWRLPAETGAAIRDGWVHTGDLGSRDAEGFLSVVGRLKEVIRSAGENIFPAEIERALLQHPQISEAAAVGIPDPHWGEAVAVAVVPRAGAALSTEAVIEHVRTHLASFKKPKHVCFLPHLPRTAASRQVHKPLLRELILEQIGAAPRR